jgi:hypothetical protein
MALPEGQVLAAGSRSELLRLTGLDAEGIETAVLDACPR